MATGQELTPGQKAWSRGEEVKHAMTTGQELTPGQNAWSRGEEGKACHGYWSRTNSWPECTVTW